MKTNLIKIQIIFGLLFFISTGNLFAQDPSNSGRDFYVAFGKNGTIENPLPVKNVELILRITTSAETKVSLSFVGNSALNTTFTIPAETIYDYVLSTAEAQASYLGAATYKFNKSIHITTDNPVTVIAVNTASANIEATLVWPVESWGTEYYNITIPPLNTSHSNGFVLIAKENGTHVSYHIPTSVTPVNVTLDEGESYVYNVNINIMGTYVVSDKPIAFFQTGSKSTIGTINNLTFEQFLPTNQWGTRFILPTNEYGAAYALVFAKEDNTTITVTYSSGATEIFPLSTINIFSRTKEIIINNAAHFSENACYITSNKPVGVVTYHIPKGYDMSQPGEAWLPPIEQRMRDVLISPLDLNGVHVYMPINHYMFIITPTDTKNNTTISIDGADYQLINQLPSSTFSWIADNIGGSGYSFGRYNFGQSYAAATPPVFLNTTAWVNNPDGLIVLAWGQGSYTNYYYMTGSGYRDLTADFTVNDIAYFEMDGRAYCNTSDFTFVASPDTLTSVIWNLNGVEIPESRNSVTVNVDNLPDGYYTAEMVVYGKSYITHFYVGENPFVWTPENNSGANKQNWHNPKNWTPKVVPSSCHNVFIPGNSSHYPVLIDGKPGECRMIYFMQGAELGRPDLLTYEKAYVQYNFGLTQSTQQKVNDKDLVLCDNTTTGRMLYSAAVSSEPLERERWYMLSSPLRKVITGDFGFGGFPLTFLKKFGPIEKEGQNYSVGNWTTTYRSMVEPVSSNPTGGFAFYMYGWGNPYGNDGCYETGSFNTLNDLTRLPASRGGKNYGLKETNGILELPFHADSIGLYAHRTQVYNPVSNESTFYYINDGIIVPADLNKLHGASESVPREDNNGNYRFAPEVYSSGSWSFPNTVYHPGTGITGDDEFLAGNPYMSSIDMLAFLDDNSATVLPQFRIWNGTDFTSCSVAGNTVISTDPADINPGYIAPMQGFFLRTVSDFKGAGDVAAFDVRNISTVRPVNTASNLRKSTETKEENILRIRSDNGAAVSYALIGYREGASNAFVYREDIQKLFSPLSYVPEIYSLVGDIPVSINFINGDVVVPLGIKTGRRGEIRLTFTGMDNYTRVSTIELFDALENRTIDLTGKPSYTYTFNQTETGIRNGRLSLRFGKSMTGLPEINGLDDLKVYGDYNGIYVTGSPSNPVHKVAVYDLQGRKVYESDSNAGYYPLPGRISQSPMIVKVVTGNETKTVKLNIKL